MYDFKNYRERPVVLDFMNMYSSGTTVRSYDSFGHDLGTVNSSATRHSPWFRKARIPMHGSYGTRALMSDQACW
jgi:hypothetical protein